MYQHLAWPMSAALVSGLLGYLLMPLHLKQLWLLCTLLSLAGAFLSIPQAAALGGIAFVTATPWLFALQPGGSLTGEVFLVYALIPFTPLWLAATRAHDIRAARLHLLLELPQVRAAMDVSDWSLLPTPRALDRRLRTHMRQLRNGSRDDPALLFRIGFEHFDRSRDLLGDEALQDVVLELSGELRRCIRSGDMMAEDIAGHSVLYVLTFPNPERADSREAILNKIRPVLAGTGLPLRGIDYAYLPQDGERMHGLDWKAAE